MRLPAEIAAKLSNTIIFINLINNLAKFDMILFIKLMTYLNNKYGIS
jgi:hypothetical protein